MIGAGAKGLNACEDGAAKEELPVGLLDDMADGMAYVVVIVGNGGAAAVCCFETLQTLSAELSAAAQAVPIPLTQKDWNSS
jgi:hypothetical protein